MKRIMLVGRSEAGKTTLLQALMNKEIKYEKTQSISYDDVVIDTPGEYIQTKQLGSALAVYAYESDVVGLLAASDEPYSLYPPCIVGMCNREVIGIVTKINDERGSVSRAENWLKIAGCKKIFKVDSKTGEGIPQLKEYLERKTTKTKKNTQKTS